MSDEQKRIEEILAKVRPGGINFEKLEKQGILTKEEIRLLAAYVMREMDLGAPSDDPHERLGDLLSKITMYQRTLPTDRPVSLDELARESVLSADDILFMEKHSVTYKPHRMRDYHSMDMFHMPTEDGGCVFIGPGGPELKKRTHRVEGFQKVIEDFLRLPDPDLLMHIEFTEDEGCGVSPKLLMFHFKSLEWRQRIDAVRDVAGELGIEPNDDRECQERWMLNFETPNDPATAAAVAYALLTRGCGIAGEIIYSAGALDVLEEEG
jgi:hypothetical protein